MAATTKLIGRQFGRLTVMRRTENTHRGEARWVCTCECGQQAVATSYSLTSGHTQSCGCLQRERTAAAAKVASKTHGESRSPEWNSWHAMRARCRYPKAAGYARYGGRGISVCDRWSKYENFLHDMGRRPGASYSLDRINPDGNYEPGNCRWASKLEQANNRRDNKRIVIQGRQITLRNAIRAAGSVISITAAERRIRRGMSPDNAVSQPARGKG